jgi:outer membrane protein assembly factor BamB
MIRRTPLLVALLAAAVAVSSCSTISRLNPLKKDKGPSEIASEGKRISIVPADQQIAPSDALKGVDFFLPPAQEVSAWPLPGGTREQSIENVDAAPSLAIAWKRGFGAGSKKSRFLTAPPVIADGKVFVMDADGMVSARDARSGSEVWRRMVRPSTGRRDKSGYGGGVAYADGKLYVSSGFRGVAQLDATTGVQGWSTVTEQPIHAAPTVADGRVMVVALDNTLLTFDAATGAPGWTYQALSEPARMLAASSPAVTGDTVIASFGSGELIALRTQNGNDLWNEALSRASRTSALSEIRDISGRPVIYRGDVFAVSHSGVFAATDVRTGQQRWSLPVIGLSTPLPVGDVVYIVSKAGEVICVARESGQIYWIRDLNEGVKTKKKGGFLGMGGARAPKPLWSGPLMANDRLILVSSNGQLAALNAKTGEVQTRVALGDGSLLSPIAAGGTIYVVTDNATLIALR